MNNHIVNKTRVLIGAKVAPQFEKMIQKEYEQMQRMRYFDPHRSAYIPIQTLPDGRIQLAIRSTENNRRYNRRQAERMMNSPCDLVLYLNAYASPSNQEVRQWSKVQPRCAYLYSLLAAVQLFGESRYPANAPAFSKEGFFFSCPMAFCAFRYVCHFFVAALCAACIRAMLSGFLNISHRREWMSRSLWTRSRVFRAACSVREQINALQISGRTG